MEIDIGLVWFWIANVAAVLTIVQIIGAMVFPTQYEILKNYLFKPIKERLINNNEITINLSKRYKITDNSIRNIEKYRHVIKNKFNSQSPVFEKDGHILKGKLEKMKYTIRIDIIFYENDDGVLEEILFKQCTNIKFKNIIEGMNNLFDNFNSFNNIKNFRKMTDDVDINAYSNEFKFNSFVEALGDNIVGINFSIQKENKGYSIHYNGLMMQEVIKKIKEIILVATDLKKE